MRKVSKQGPKETGHRQAPSTGGWWGTRQEDEGAREGAWQPCINPPSHLFSETHQRALLDNPHTLKITNYFLNVLF